MTTMKAAVFYKAKDLRVVDVPKATAGDDGVLIKVKAVGVCGTDLHTYTTGMFKEMSIPVDGGALLGHEFAGEVMEIAPGVELNNVAVGDRVAGVTLGAFAEYCRCGPELLGTPAVLKLPDNISFEEAATIEPLTVSLAAVRRASPQPGDKVLIIGAGMIGLGCLQILKALYCECEVIISDVSAKRLAMAKTFGADRVINAREQDVVAQMKAETGEEGVIYNSKTTAQVDVVLECAGLELTINQALEVVKPFTGRLVLVALYENSPKVDLNQVVSKNIDLLGILDYGLEDFRVSIELMASGKVDRKPLITHCFALADAKDAFESQLKTTETLKAVITT